MAVLRQIVSIVATLGLLVGAVASLGLVLFGLGTIGRGGRDRDALRLRLGCASLLAGVMVWVLPIVAASVEATTHRGPAYGDMWVVPPRTLATLGISAWLAVAGTVLALPRHGGTP